MPRTALAPAAISAFRRRATDAAMHLFATRGYPSVTMRALAAALGVSAMTPYRYFANKDALFAQVRAEAFRRFADRLEAALAGRGDALARLRRLKAAYVAFALDEPDAYAIMFELRQPDPTGHRELQAESRRAFAALHRTVAAAVAAGRLEGDPLTVAHLLWAGAHGLVSLHLAGKLAGRTLAQLASVNRELDAFKPKPKPKSRRST
jgi:AcrR family transcriptional regulator